MAEDSQVAPETPTSPTGGRRRGFTLEIVGEIVLLAMAGGMFAYLFIQSFTWPAGAALMPRITVALGTPFWVWRLVSLIRSTQEETSSEQIMDLGFRTGADPKGERIRFFRICSSIIGLYVAIWLVGFHIALPIGVAVYMYVYGRAGLVWSAVVGLLFLGLIVGVYDHFLNATWHSGLRSGCGGW